MRLYKLFTLLLIPILSSFYMHKYYLSVTDLTYNEEEKSVQMITRLFYDDLEAVLQERYDKNLEVNQDAEQKEIDYYLSKYLSKKLKITINSVDQELHYLGKEYEDDYVVAYIEIANVTEIKTLEIDNSLLIDLFLEQKNMVHTDILNKKKSLLLHEGSSKTVLNF